MQQTVNQPKAVLRANYQPPAFWIDHIDLTFDLDPDKTCVLNKMQVRRNLQANEEYLYLNGEELNLSRVLVNGQSARFVIEDEFLIIKDLPAAAEGAFELEIFNTCSPIKNTALSGLYISNESFFTQCEAEGFRRITYFLDRPDVMASYQVTIRADKTKYPVLLSNGNLIDSGKLDANRHFAVWQDPFKKPSYLFALVAGQFQCREQKIIDKHAQEHLLQIYVRAGDLDKTAHALSCLQSAIAWDEQRFNLSLDLERFMIVAVSDFNMGAMENKGLNIFNSKCILANPLSATDKEYDYVQSVVGHEYFHNWSGNRVTCRDWFQLSLKEGLTVFREQEFSQDLCANASSKAVKRINDVQLLRNRQWPEDNSPMAHPVRPDSYMEINNFYTMTIYEKGAEVIRMLQTLVGRTGFSAGLSLYFARFDGQAVTCDDFVQAIADANPDSALYQNLTQFKLWYSQIGTPSLTITDEYNSEQQSYTLNVQQSTPHRPEQKPMLIPLVVGLIDDQGHSIATQLANQEATAETLLVVSQAQQSFTFNKVASQPIPSLLRNFSAPVQLNYAYTDQQLISLLKYDSDAFNRWEACQRLANARLLTAIKTNNLDFKLDAEFINALKEVLLSHELTPAFKALALSLPSEIYLAEQLSEVDPQLIHTIRHLAKQQINQQLCSEWQQVFAANQVTHYKFNETDAGKRQLTGLALINLCSLTEQQEWLTTAKNQLVKADNLTDKQHALSALINSSSNAEATAAFNLFYEQFKHNELVIDNWFALQANANDRNGDILAKVTQLLKHADFNYTNPNRVRSVISSFCSNNPAAFHRQDGAGYKFWAKQVITLNSINPQIAARVARALDSWQKLAQPYQQQALQALQKVAQHPDLCRDVKEIIFNNLASVTSDQQE